MKFSEKDFTESAISRLVKRRHPYYAQMLAHWHFLRDCYNGGPEWFKENIFRYIKEGDKEFSDRVKRAYRFNHTREVVDLVNKYLFRSKPTRNERDAPEQLIKFWESSTINGLGINEFAKSISTKTSIYGRIYVVVDSTVTEDMITEEDIEEAHAQVYAYIVTPEDVLDMSYDSRGVLNWILIREYVRDDESPIVSSGKTEIRYRLWTRNQWFVFKGSISEFESSDINSMTPVAVTSQPTMRDMSEKLELIATGDHNMGEVPVIPSDNTVSDELYFSPSLVGDVAYLDRASANYASNLDAIIQDQTFSQLAMPAQGLLPGDDEYEKLLELGTKRIFIYDGEGGSQPTFLSPDPRQAQLISAAINQIIAEIYHSVGLGIERSKDVSTHNADKASGVAKSIDFERVAALLISKADSMQYIENRISRIVAKWSGIDTERDEFVSYPVSFDVRELYDEFYIATQLSLIQMPVSIRGEQMKAIVEKLFPQMSVDLRERIESDIQTWVGQEKELADQQHLHAVMDEVVATTEIITDSSIDGSSDENSQSLSDAQQKEQGEGSDSKDSSISSDAASATETNPQTVVIVKELQDELAEQVSESLDGDSTSELQDSGKYKGQGHDKANGMGDAKALYKSQKTTLSRRKRKTRKRGNSASSERAMTESESRAREEALRNREISGRIQSISKSKTRNNRKKNEEK